MERPVCVLLLIIWGISWMDLSYLGSVELRKVFSTLAIPGPPNLSQREAGLAFISLYGVPYPLPLRKGARKSWKQQILYYVVTSEQLASGFQLLDLLGLGGGEESPQGQTC